MIPLPGSLYEADHWFGCGLYYDDNFIIEFIYLPEEDRCCIDWSYAGDDQEIILL